MKASLTPARQRLLRLLQEVEFGRIENLVLRDGEPLLEMQPRVVRTITFAATGSRNRSRRVEEFELKQQMVEMFRQFDRIGNGVVARIDIKHGLPCFMTVEETACDVLPSCPPMETREGGR